MAIILSIETSTQACSVAIHENNILISYLEVQISKSHSESLTLLIEQAMRFSKISLKEIDAIALSMGPGSYTGLRVGTSTAKGLAMALDKPLIAINTLESMAFEVNKANFNKAILCPMLDARRMEVYCALLDFHMQVLEETKAVILDESSFVSFLNTNKVVFFGDGSNKFKVVTNSINALFLDDIVPSARSIGYLAFKSWEQGKFENLHAFEPFYLKDFVMRNN